MDIITRNYLRLLRAGAFQEQETIEPMSAWKWAQVYDISLLHHTTALVFDGIRQCQDQFFLNIGRRLLTQWQEKTLATERSYSDICEQAHTLFDTLRQSQCRPLLVGSIAYSQHYAKPFHRETGSVTLFFPYDTQGRKADSWAEANGTDILYPDRHTVRYRWQGITVTHRHRLLQLSNKLLAHNLRNLVEQELRESKTDTFGDEQQPFETFGPTLTLFQMLLQQSCDLITSGILLLDLIDLGSFLRNSGHRVDYIKLQGWIERMKMQRMTQIIAQLLCDLLSFTPDELPFTSLQRRYDLTSIIHEILTPSSMRSKRMTFTQGSSGIFVHSSNSSAFMWHARRSARFLRYYPSESITSLFTSFARSLTNIEE